MANVAIVGLNAAKMFLKASWLKLWADNCELMVRNYEKGLDAFGSVIERQREAA